MLTADRLKVVEEMISTLSKEELIWLNGYIAGKFSATPVTEPVTTTAPSAKSPVNKITITYGTETGNSKKLASAFALKAKQSGITAKCVSLDQYRLNDLPKESYLLSIISTQGEGDPPAAAKKFYDHIHHNDCKLENLKYGVLALGDTAYPLFCKAGEDVDQQLNRLGGNRIIPLHKCDVDYENDANNWFEQVLQQLTNVSPANNVKVAPAVAARSTGRKIYNGTILTNMNLNDRGSRKQTHHIEIAAEELDYLPGDALGLIPENPLQLVEQVLELLEVDRNETFSFRNETLTAFDILKKKANIIYLPGRVVAKYARLAEHDIPETKMGLLDLLRIYPLKDNTRFDQLIEIMEPIAPRLYSIASSPEAHNGEIHLTVAKEQFMVNDEQKYGLCSAYLTNLAEETSFEFYIHKNNQFRLPEDDKDIIMIGPGTGVAPFRSFLAHRDATGASGRNWLFFGDQHFVTDFLYQTELQNWVETGTLTRLNVAFSRDQQEKVYVQHKMLKHGKELYEWLLNGASFYICGLKNPMSVDVENTLLRIIEEHGNKSKEDAIAFLDQLKSEGRYLTDVY